MPSVVINPDEWLIEPVWGNDDMGNYVLLNPGVRKPAQDTGSPGPPAPTPSGGSRGYGGYSGGGAPSPAARQSLQDDFIDWFGRAITPKPLSRRPPRKPGPQMMCAATR